MVGKILLALTFVQGQANPAAGVIQGQIIVPSVRASERLLVVLQRSDGPVVARIYSDTLGHYEFKNLASGTYSVIVDLEGYEEVRQQVAVAGSGPFATQLVNIALQPKDKPIAVKTDGGAANEIVDISELGRKYPRKAVQDYEKALEELRNSNDAKAIELLAGVVKVAPDFYGAHNKLGTLYQKTKRFRDAEAEYRRAHELNPRAADPMVNLGSMFIEEAAARSGEGAGVTGKILDSALDTLEESLKIKRSPMAYQLLGTAYYRSAFYEEAEANLKRSLELDPHLPGGRLMLANVYIKQQKWRSALEHLDAYLNENPKAGDRDQIQETRSKVAQQIK